MSDQVSTFEAKRYHRELSTLGFTLVLLGNTFFIKKTLCLLDYVDESKPEFSKNQKVNRLII